MESQYKKDGLECNRSLNYKEELKTWQISLSIIVQIKSFGLVHKKRNFLKIEEEKVLKLFLYLIRLQGEVISVYFWRHRTSQQ